MDSFDTTVSELRRGKPVTKLWHIKGLNDPFIYNVLKTQAVCRLEMAAIENIPVFVEFFLKECKRTTKTPAQALEPNFGQSYHSGKETVYVDLYARTVTHQSKMHFAVNLDEINETRKNGEKSVRTNSRFKDEVIYYENGGTKEVCLQYGFLVPYSGCASQITSSTKPDGNKGEYKFRITVTPLYSNEDLEADYKKAVGSLSDDLGKLLSPSANENFADLKLETKDNMTLSAHKVLLAARSPFFRTLIEKETKKKDFNGTIKLENVNAKPMVAILQWIYTGDVPPTAGRVMEEVVDAAVAFNLTGLLKFLDKKLITICNTENMFDLYKVAKANGMTSAMADLSEFITENLKKF